MKAMCHQKKRIKLMHNINILFNLRRILKSENENEIKSDSLLLGFIDWTRQVYIKSGRYSSVWYGNHWIQIDKMNLFFRLNIFPILFFYWNMSVEKISIWINKKIFWSDFYAIENSLFLTLYAIIVIRNRIWLFIKSSMWLNWKLKVFDKFMKTLRNSLKKNFLWFSVLYVTSLEFQFECIGAGPVPEPVRAHLNSVKLRK